MPGKARKETKRAVAALRSGNLRDAEKHLDVAYNLVPSSPDLNFLMGYLYFQKRDYAQAGNYLGTATNLRPHDVQALTLLGRVSLEREDYRSARSALEQALEADAENWLPRNLLADSYLRQRNYEKAREQAELAITKGKGKASPAQLVLGQAGGTRPRSGRGTGTECVSAGLAAQSSRAAGPLSHRGSRAAQLRSRSNRSR